MSQHASPLAGVAYDASVPLNKAVRSRMASSTLGEFLAARPGSGTPVITLDVDDSIGHAMEVSRGGAQLLVQALTVMLWQTLARHRISSAPVLESAEAGGDTQRAPFYGFFDVPTAMNAFFKGL